MLIIPPLLNPKCFHTNFKLIVNILYFTKFKIKISEIRKRNKNESLIHEYRPLLCFTRAPPIIWHVLTLRWVHRDSVSSSTKQTRNGGGKMTSQKEQTMKEEAGARL